MILRDDTIKLLKKLISIKSLSGDEEEIAYFIYEYLSKAGYNIKIERVSGNLCNVILEIGDKKPAILIEAHMDVVPKWDMKSAFKPKLIDGKIYGRGACDVKGGLASLILALERGAEENLCPTNKFIIAFTGDEEMYGRGATLLLAKGYNADYGIVIEPTNLKVCNVVAGCLEFILTVYGKSGHGAVYNSGDNALYKLINILVELTKWRWLNQRGNMENMKNHINIGKIRGGVSGWMVPSKAETDVLIHFIPKYTTMKVKNKVLTYLNKICTKYNTKYEVEWIHSCEGYTLQDSHYLVREMSRVVKKYLKTSNVVGYMPSESDANIFYHIGNIDTIVFGPGDLKVAHSSSEYIDINDVVTASNILYEFIFKRSKKSKN